MSSVEDIKPIFLKRDTLELWCNELFEKFQKAVKGCLVYLPDKGRYLLAEIVDAQEKWEVPADKLKFKDTY